VLIDANILLYSVNEADPRHHKAKQWLEQALNGERRVAIPWVSYWAFMRIVTNPRALERPLSAASAWEAVSAWLGAPSTWVPEPGSGHALIMGELIATHDVRGGHMTDAVLAALCIEYGLAVVSNDSDFARFPEIEWLNPLL
jgi:toxin-antitoxin system PIN domain toxin